MIPQKPDTGEITVPSPTVPPVYINPGTNLPLTPLIPRTGGAPLLPALIALLGGLALIPRKRK